jgi:broad specificity phosphatase PhoE
MLVLLVRHCHAGSKGCAGADDSLRPLSARGRAEADVIAEQLTRFAPGRVISSPLLRCVQTVEPLLTRTALALELSEALRPDAGKAATDLLRECAKKGPGPVVLCTHGEVIEVIQSDPRHKSPHKLWHSRRREKGSVWILQYTGGRVTSADYRPPPFLAG